MRPSILGQFLLGLWALLCPLASAVPGSFECKQPLISGELRIMKSRLCVDILETDGKGDVIANTCDGYTDQQFIICGDGTIRNQRSQNNCLSPGSDGKGNVESKPCVVQPEIPDYQKWTFGATKTFVDTGDITQVAREIINVKSGLYLDVWLYEGDDNIGMANSDGKEDQFFYIRSRGALIDKGWLHNNQSGNCLDVANYDGEIRSNVQLYTCEDKLDQFFRFYENGELVCERSKLCVDLSDKDGDGNHKNALLYGCEDYKDQMWTRPESHCIGDYCSFLSKASGQCLEPEGDKAEVDANVLSWECTGEPDQRFKFVSDAWTMPTASWSQVACNQNGGVTHKIISKTEYAESVTDTIATQVSASIETGFVFASETISGSVSTSLSNTWSETHSHTDEVDFTCDNYDSGEEFTGGCMWRLNMDIQNTVHNNDNLNWQPVIVKCTKNLEAPVCPPFTVCADQECTHCNDLIFF